MAYLEDDNDRGMLLKIVGGVVALVVVLAVGIGGFAAWRNSPERIQGEINAAVDDDPTMGPLFQELRKNYPADYKAFTDHLVSLQQRGASTYEAQTSTRQLARRLMLSHVADFRAAPAEELVKVRDGNLDLIRALKAESTAMCAHFAISGLQPGEIPSKRTLKKVGMVGAAQVRAMAAGRDHPVKRSQPTESDVTKLRGQLTSLGISDGEFAAMVNGATVTLNEERQCALGIALYQGLVNLDPGPSERLGALILLPDQQ